MYYFEFYVFYDTQKSNISKNISIPQVPAFVLLV